MPFEQMHKTWLEEHLQKRKGERKNRLERGHQHAEKLFLKNVWFPMTGHFSDLHPEYEITDFRGQSYFADFALLRCFVKIIIEIKGFKPHVQDMNRHRYCYELNRELFMQGLGFRVISFAYDDVDQRPELCITLLRMLLSRYQSPREGLRLTEREIISLALSDASPLRPIDGQQLLHLNHRTAVKHLQRLCEKGWFRPVHANGGKRVLYYERVKRNIDDYGW